MDGLQDVTVVENERLFHFGFAGPRGTQLDLALNGHFLLLRNLLGGRRSGNDEWPDVSRLNNLIIIRPAMGA